MSAQASALASPLPPTLPTRLLPVLPHAHRHYGQIFFYQGQGSPFPEDGTTLMTTNQRHLLLSLSSRERGDRGTSSSLHQGAERAEFSRCLEKKFSRLQKEVEKTELSPVGAEGGSDLAELAEGCAAGAGGEDAHSI